MTDLIGPCATEDSTNCYWNAPTMGNRQGDSFIDIEGTVTYIEGCQPGEGLPAVDIAADGTPWAYCELALGNDTIPEHTTTATVPEPTITELPATGLNLAIDPAPIIYAGLTILILGIILRLRVIAIRKDKK